MFSKTIKNILKRIFCLLPLKNIIIFESHPDFADNTYWFFEFLVREKHIQKKYKLVWFVNKNENIKTELCGARILCVNISDARLSQKFKRMYYNYTAKIIIECNQYVYKMREKQIRIHLGHGMPLKMADEYMSNIGKCDLYSIIGEGFREYYEQFLACDVIKNYGYVRNDVFLQAKKQIHDSKIIMWLPTYRQHKKAETQRIITDFPLGIPIVKKESDWERINTYLLDRNIKLLLRPHPAQDMSVLQIKDCTNIIILDDNCIKRMETTLYELLANSDALITDYSSVYYDYLFVKKPIALTLEDAEQFSKKWKFFFEDIKNNLPGNKLQTVDDLFEFVDEIYHNKDQFCAQREKLFNELEIKRQMAAPQIWMFLEERISSQKTR